MFKLPHHQRILKALASFDAELLAQAKCYLSGSTAISMCLGEYRQSININFLCADIEGYRLLRNMVGVSDLGQLLKPGLKSVSLVRDVRSEQNKILTALAVDGAPIKLEFTKESRVSISGAWHSSLPVPLLSRPDLYTQKLLANDDRGLDSSTNSRDIIDLAMMIQHWGRIPQVAWDKALVAYGDRLRARFHQAVEKISESAHLKKCLRSLEMDDDLFDAIGRTLRTASSQLPVQHLEDAWPERKIGSLRSGDLNDGGR